MDLNFLSISSEFKGADLPKQQLAESGFVSIHYFWQPCSKFPLHKARPEVIK